MCGEGKEKKGNHWKHFLRLKICANINRGEDAMKLRCNASRRIRYFCGTTKNIFWERVLYELLEKSLYELVHVCVCVCKVLDGRLKVINHSCIKGSNELSLFGFVFSYCFLVLYLNVVFLRSQNIPPTVVFTGGENMCTHVRINWCQCVNISTYNNNYART